MNKHTIDLALEAAQKRQRASRRDFLKLRLLILNPDERLRRQDRHRRNSKNARMYLDRVMRLLKE